MEFHEKLQELRKSRGLTQEELAEILFVSRTAISKWESGRGYPSIDSLKSISNYFSITIDELLSGDKLLSLAEKENKTNVRRMCEILYGMMDVLSIILIVLPLYPKTVEGYVYAVSLIDYMEKTTFYSLLHWILFLMLFLIGTIKIVLIKIKTEKYHKSTTYISIGLSILIVLFLAICREAYAIIVTFLLLVMKTLLLFEMQKCS